MQVLQAQMDRIRHETEALVSGQEAGKANPTGSRRRGTFEVAYVK